MARKIRAYPSSRPLTLPRSIMPPSGRPGPLPRYLGCDQRGGRNVFVHYLPTPSATGNTQHRYVKLRSPPTPDVFPPGTLPA